jgi:hypothetical protein
MFGETITYSDFFLVNVIETLIYLFGEEKTHSILSPELKNHLNLMKSRPSYEKFNAITSTSPPLFPAMKYVA